LVALYAGARGRIAYVRSALAVLGAVELALIVRAAVTRRAVGVLDALRASPVGAHVGQALPAGRAIPGTAAAGLAGPLNADLAGVALVVGGALGFLLAGRVNALHVAGAVLVVQALDAHGGGRVAMGGWGVAVGVGGAAGPAGVVHAFLSGVAVAVFYAHDAQARSGVAARRGGRAVAVTVAECLRDADFVDALLARGAIPVGGASQIPRF